MEASTTVITLNRGCIQSRNVIHKYRDIYPLVLLLITNFCHLIGLPLPLINSLSNRIQKLPECFAFTSIRLQPSFIFIKDDIIYYLLRNLKLLMFSRAGPKIRTLFYIILFPLESNQTSDKYALLP
jgi:hypothetical protein